MCVCVSCIYISPLFCQSDLGISKALHDAQELPGCSSIYAVTQSRFEGQERPCEDAVHYDWLLRCKTLWNLTINSISLHHICKQWWKPSGAAKRGVGAGSTCPSQPLQMAFWVMSQHCWKVEKGHWGWQIMIFKSKQSPRVDETHLFFKSPRAPPWPHHKRSHWVVLN